MLGEDTHEHLVDRRVLPSEATQLRATEDEGLTGLAGRDGRAALGARDHRYLAEDLLLGRRSSHVAVRSRDADVEAPFGHQVHRIRRVVVVEDDLPASVRAPARERENGANVVRRIPANSCHCICHKVYTCCVARDDDAPPPAS